MKLSRVLPCVLGTASLLSHAGESMTENTGIKEESSLHAPAYGGLVANQTMTVAGYDFYRQFVAAWRDKQGSDRYTLSIHEQPSARFGSRVWVEFSHRRIFQTVLPATRSSLQPLSEQAADIAYAAVLDAEMEQAMFRDPDLAADELN